METGVAEPEQLEEARLNATGGKGFTVAVLPVLYVHPPELTERLMVGEPAEDQLTL